MKRLFTFLAFAFALIAGVAAQSSLFVRNNSWLAFDFTMEQKGSHTASGINFSENITEALDWIEDTEAFITARDSSVVPNGGAVIYAMALSHGNDTVWMDFKLMGNGSGTDFAFRLHGNGYDTGFLSDQSFHSANVTIAGRNLEIKFRADNDDSQLGQDIRLAIHETEIYHIDSADYSNPNVLNVMAYNIQFLPLGVVGLPQAAERGDLLPSQLSPYQDVVIFEEVFDPIPRLVNLIPAMRDAGFFYDTGILNDYLPFNGGVIIFSRWPIDATAMYDFALCGPNAQDCLANKGIMYAKVNKLGKSYHVFGTHMDAGGDSADVEARNLQYTEMREFIGAQGISSSEPVIWGGDLNTDLNNSHNDFYKMRDSIDFIGPDYTGFPSSTMNRDTGDVIDHLFTDPRYLLPTEGEVFITTFRSVDPVLWDLSDFSDHRCAIGRFKFPDLNVTGGDQDLCPGDPMAFQSSADILVQRSWYHDGNMIPGVTGGAIAIASTTLPDSGLYEVEMRYSRTYGTASGPVNHLMYPSGPVTRNASPRLRAGLANVSLANCPISRQDAVVNRTEVYPNPAADYVQLRREGGSPLTWELRDLQGKCLQHGTWTGTEMEIDLHAHASGMYLLRLTGKAGQIQNTLLSVAR
jgi:hypothetical protein